MYVPSRCRRPALDPILNSPSPPPKHVRDRHDKFAKENNVQDVPLLVIIVAEQK
jgi:hypothetical protein